MDDDQALSGRSLAKTATLSLAGLAILAVVVFAVLNVAQLERWNSDLGEFLRSRPLPLPVWFLIAFAAGIVTSLTPCVYPVIPLAVTYLGARSATSRLRAFSLAGAYVIGMVVCYTVLGAAAGLAGTAFGTATQKWWVYAAVATVVLLFGLSMLGAFTIRLPGRLTALASRGGGPGYKGAVLMGATSGLVTAPCTAPVLATLLSLVSNKSAALGSLLLAVFGLGMGMLFLVVGTYSGVLASMPRSGRWMNVVKVGLGTSILLVSAYFYYQAWLKLPFGHAGAAAAGTESGEVVSSEENGWPRANAVHLSRASFQPANAAASTAEETRPAAPEFSIEDTKGRRHDLGAYRGKTLHLVFFAVWCPPCVKELRRIEAADARLRGRGYRVLVIAMKERQDQDSVRAFGQEHQVELPLAWDKKGGVAAAFGVDSIPKHVVIGPDGTILYQGRDLPDGFEKDGAGLLAP